MSRDLVCIERFADVTQADMARMLLEAEGIPAFLEGANLAQMYSLLIPAIGGVKLLAPTGEAERARAILDAHQMPDPPGPSAGRRSAETAGDRCLCCGASMKPDQEVCSECGWSYAADEASE